MKKQGFGLLEMLVTLAIMGVIMLGFMQMTSNNFKAQKGVQDFSDLNSFGTALQQVMNLTVGCTANLTAGAQPVQFDTTQTGLQTTIAGKPILPEIDYPMLSGGVYVPNPNSPLITSTGTYQNWQVTQMGLRVLGQEGPTTYNISVEVDFMKINTQSFGGPSGLKQATAITVTTTTPGPGIVTVQQCGGDETILPSGAVMAFNLLACPTGWTAVTQAQGRYIVGLNPGGSLAGIAPGSRALGDLEARMVPQHNHGLQDYWTFEVGGDCVSNTCGVPVGNATGSTYTAGDYPAASLAAPYIQYLICMKN